ncbi:spinster family MFS transporter [Niveispirillum irakense]|uniref:spinster family MFS transporter n=1 Tax=Niveispirillum irakense TaxID=34011 RepID=UPI0003FBE66F|nr:MFS transporter [Niveispirillum irakense]
MNSPVSAKATEGQAPVSKGDPVDTEYSRGYRAMLLVLILLVAAFAYVDRVIVQTLAEPIKKDLGLSDFQFGLLGGLAFALLYSTLGLPIARLAERRDRVTIISVSVAVFSLMSLLCGMATNIWTLFLCRIGVGIGEAGVQAPSTSLIGDHFPPHRRGFALTVMRLGAPVGSLLGSVVAAWLARDYGWRVALMLVCAPGLIVAVLFRLLLRDPPRGHSDRLAGVSMPKAGTAAPRTLEVFAQMFRRPAFRHMLAGLGLTSMALFAGGAFTAPFFMRVHELSLTTTAFYVAIISTTASTAGMSLGGFGIDFIARRGKRWYALLPFWGIAISVPLYLTGYAVDNHVVAVTLITIAGIFLFFHSVPTLVAFQNMVAPQQRTTAAFVYFFVSTMVGVGFGPPLLGLLSDFFASTAGVTDPAEASAIGIRSALLTSIGLYAWAALHYGLASRAMAAEERP